jgi:trafficking protein particle complex subunit 11
LDEVYPIIIEVTNEDDRELDVTIDVLLQPTETDDTGMKVLSRSHPLD